jgi:PilZ domain-containing protein
MASSLAVRVRAGRHSIVGIATDLGPGGMFVSATETLPYATEVDVRFGRTDLGIELNLPATVRWTTPLGFGLQFGRLGARETRALLLLLASA